MPIFIKSNLQRYNIMDKENMQYMDSLKKKVLEFLLPKGEIVDVIIENQVEDSIVFKKDFPLSINITRNILVGEFFGRKVDEITNEELQSSLDILLDKHVKDYSDDDDIDIEPLFVEEDELKTIKFIILNDMRLDSSKIDRIKEKLEIALADYGILLDGSGFDLEAETREYYYK